ncbi:hypothetical protein [Arenimonas oryziterrae]|uniref:Uncharacterized protein n=1 Tax=Arenimonas oryziterrae DSM 21050 = YC6267 TaxID=1121015 RepID=A0A091AQZ4_9GAMM|nr:hypothetical protein [Arenimonas oryziterrae]KFN42593.1 hypothetical protein N789_13210 [Arenimonas oryziterrae DSM 21050 = YC6267]
MTQLHPDSTVDIRSGDIYEDSAFHPCLCIGIEDGMAWGISLIDGSYPRNADLHMSGVRKLTPAQAWEWKQLGVEKVAEIYFAEVGMDPGR